MQLEGLRHARRMAAMSQAELAAKSRVDRAAISMYETGRRGAQPSTARRLAEALGVTPADLLADPTPVGIGAENGVRA